MHADVSVPFYRGFMMADSPSKYATICLDKNLGNLYSRGEISEMF
jgi:hypothetical protein